jgi:RNA polymerase sigma-70 factor (ECF subfamily)
VGTSGNDAPPADDLAARFRAGDTAALGAAYDAFAPDVYRFCWRRAEQDPGCSAEDLLSVVFLEAWGARRRAVAVDGSMRPWLLGVANNVVRNQRRSLRRHRAALARLPAQQAAPGHDDEVAARVDDAAALARTMRALASLSHKEREVIELCGVEGLDTATVARLLRVPHGTVKSRLARARARLAALSRPGDTTDPPAVGGHEPGGRLSGAPALGGATWTL